MNKFYLLLLTLIVITPSQAFAEGCVILLHGLARTSSSMQAMADSLEEHDYSIANINYPSRKYPIETLAPLAIEAGLKDCPVNSTIHFVTHSMGGILVRYYLKNNEIRNLGRVVMLAPPNKGSEVVDDYKDVWGFAAFNGPAGLQIGTDNGGMPVQLGSVDYAVGIIAGTKTFNPVLSQSLPNPDDGKVSLENTKVEGMQDFISVPYSHTFIMKAPAVIEQVLAFLKTGKFMHNPQPPDK